MAISDSILQQWNNWKHQYESSSDPAVRRKALEGMQALDIQDDGQKNNSVDNSMSIWDIQDPAIFVPKPGPGPDGVPGGTEGPGTGGGPGGTGGLTLPGDGSDAPPDAAGISNVFDSLMNQLPDDVKNKINEKFGGPDRVFSIQEKARTIEFIGNRIGKDKSASALEIETIRTDLGLPSNVNTAFDAAMGQLPDDVKNKIKEKFAGEDGVFSEEEKGKVLDLIKSKSDNHPVLTEKEIESIRKELGISNAPAPSGARRTFDEWMSQLDINDRNLVISWFAGKDLKMTDEEMNAANEFLKSKAGEDGKLSSEEIDSIKKTFDDATKVGGDLKEWQSKLPPDVWRKILEKFGVNGELNAVGRLKAHDYLKSKTGGPEYISAFDVKALRKDLGSSDANLTQDEVNKLFDGWMSTLPENIRNKLKQKFAGSDGKFSDDEKRKTVEFIGGIAGYDPSKSRQNTSALELALGISKPMSLTPSELEQVFKKWMEALPEDIRNELTKKFAGKDGKFNMAEKEKTVKWLEGAGLAGGVYKDHFDLIRDTLGMKP